MLNVRLTRLLLAVLAFGIAPFAVACSTDSNSKSPDDGGQNVDAEVNEDGGEPPNDAAEDAAAPISANISDATLAGICDYLRTCDLPLAGEGAPQVFLARALSNALTCGGILGRVLPTTKARELERLIREGRILFDQTAFLTCLTNLAENCSFVAIDDTICGDVLQGTVDEDGACTQSEECKSGLYCDTTGGDTCPGTCAPVKELGDSCSSSEECAGSSDGTPVCFEDTCYSLKSLTPSLQGQDCKLEVGGVPYVVNFTPCAPGFACDGDTGTCNAMVAPEGLCQPDSVCSAGHVCAPSSEDETLRCRPIRVRALDDDCTGEFDICDLSARLVCDEGSGTCVSVGAGKTDDPCDGTAGPLAPCAEGYFCDDSGIEPACQPQKAGTAECADNDECISGQCADDACRPAYCTFAGATER
ncbi:MAG: hypothetical protein R3A78_11380 [Polyangiales bacterium]|nr:hypothetical protein [Myxococcales bacterium]